MEKGVYYLAVFSHSYRAQCGCSYSIRVSLVSNVNLIYGPCPVVLGILVAMFLLLLTGVCWNPAQAHRSAESCSTIRTRARTFSLDRLGRPAPKRAGKGKPAGGNRGGAQQEVSGSPGFISACP